MPKTDPPRVVPQPWSPELPEEPKTNPRIKKERRRTNLKLLLATAGTVVTAVGIVFGIYRSLIADVEKAAVQTMAGHETRLTAVEQQVPQLRQEVFDGRVESRGDIKALQDAWLTRRPSKRLEQPIPPPPGLDGGAP